MGGVIVGSASIKGGMLTRAQLRWNYRAIYPDVYVPRDVEPDLATRARGAWLWSRRRGIITGRAAAALRGARWVDDDAPVEVLWSNNYSPKGVITRRDRIAPGEITWIKGMPVATPARAALDLGRYLPHSQAVAHLDSIGRATGVASADILELAHRYKGTKGVRRCRRAVDLMDADAQSPQETRIRLALIKAGFPRPETQIPLFDVSDYPFAYLDMGWRDKKIAVEYDGEHHRTDPDQYRWDILRPRRILALGWIHIKVIAGDNEFIHHVKQAWLLREREARAVDRPA